jgi:hypothetical protein
MLAEEREERIERTWRIFRMTSIAASVAVVLVLLAVDYSFRFASWQLNVVIALVAIWLFVLLKLDYWLHQLVRRVRRLH